MAATPGMEFADLKVQLDDEPTLDVLERLRRQDIGRAIIDNVPPEVLARLQIIQPATGCLNRCNFCSQQAGATVREFDAGSIRAVMGGLRAATEYHGLTQLGGERAHKPGVIFPYLDNDIGSYPHLDDMVIGLRSVGSSVRLSTVGWSRHNPDLQAMHERIVDELSDHVDGIRFSLTPYTAGWRLYHDSYIADLANAMRTYMPLIETKGVGRHTGCLEVRFRPDITVDDLHERAVGDFAVIQCGDYSLIADYSLTTRYDQVRAMEGATALLGVDGVPALQILGDTAQLHEAAIIDLFATTSGAAFQPSADGQMLVARGSAFRFHNADGPYYGFEPLKAADNSFRAIHYYPRTHHRAVSGVMDAARPLLNHLLAHKARHGKGPREDLSAATDDDIRQVYEAIVDEARMIEPFSPHRADYIRNEVLPLVADIRSLLQRADFDPALFFEYGFLTDTGVIVNQGKALGEFRGLASHPDMPLTANEEKGYGVISQSSVRGIIWRIAPVEVIRAGLKLSNYGSKSLPVIEGANGVEPETPSSQVMLGFFALNPQAFTNQFDGAPLPVIRVDVGDALPSLRTVTPGVGSTRHLMPGR